MAALCTALAVAAAVAGPAHAERADRSKPMSVTSSGGNPDVVDLKKHSAVFIGNVIITQGTLEIHADRVEVSEDPDGQRLGFAYGSPEHPATFRQKRDGEDEYSEGDSTRIEYDSAANRVRFVGAAHLRMLKGTVVTDQANAALITYDTATDTIKLGSGEAGTASSSAGGRTTVVFTPKAPASSAKAPGPLKLDTPTPAPGSTK
ncbi:lipopolysaccharide transport periplasmic protein LptA [Scleromatobacter humisilvae]|uniref:Lipopolysaccharide export system protein LptA n=1 Tax=Scleromatobacter humisilvae TaxID=2897159 RepID=A0A9X1YHA9_9BURK|nr:lipopolysaccharide transport periplasmic protein LptA [Scleromatobacter humisilvae]MCK9685901.1 lipopolysaccharide transport periplasmic protein LptA [Scleromatobacter humisilvae]